MNGNRHSDPNTLKRRQQGLCLCTLFGLILLSILPGCRKRDTGPEIEPLRQELSQIQRLTLSELVLSQTYIIDGSGLNLKNIRNLDDLGNYLDDLLRPGERKGVYRCSAFASAFIDLSELSPSAVQLSQDGQSVTLSLPELKVELEGVRPTIEVLHERQSGIKKAITPEERQTLYQRGLEQIREDLQPGHPVYDDLLENARNKALSYFAHTLLLRGYKEVTVVCANGKQLQLNQSNLQRKETESPEITVPNKERRQP